MHQEYVLTGGHYRNSRKVKMFPGNVPKMDQAQTFLATIENDHSEYEDFGCYFDSGAAHDHRSRLYRPTFDRRPGDRSTDKLSGFSKSLYLRGTIAMLSVDQFLRLISVPAVLAAFMIASQISTALNPV